MLTIGNQSESDADAPEGVSAFLALGGNLGDREVVFRDALRRLRENGFAVEAVSSFYETAPVAGGSVETLPEAGSGGRASRRSSALALPDFGSGPDSVRGPDSCHGISHGPASARS